MMPVGLCTTHFKAILENGFHGEGPCALCARQNLIKQYIAVQDQRDQYHDERDALNDMIAVLESQIADLKKELIRGKLDKGRDSYE